MAYKTSFRFLWIGQSLANSGDLLLIVSMIALVFEATKSPFYMAMIPFFVTISKLCGGLVAPVFVDRFNLKLLLAYSQLGKTLLLGFLVFMVSVMHFNLYILFLCIIGLFLLDGLATPARNSMLPLLVPSSELIKANSLLSIVDQCIQLGGWALSGVLLAFIGVNNVLALTGMLFTVSTIFMFCLTMPPNKQSKEKHTSRLTVLKEGWVYIWNHTTTRILLLLDFIDSLANVVWIAAILYIYVDEALGASKQWWGYINASFFVGMIIGSFITLKLTETLQANFRRFISIGAISMGTFTLLFGVAHSPWLALLFSCLFGMAAQIKGITQHTLLQTITPSEFLPKVFSAQVVIVSGTFGLSSLLFGYMTEVLGVRFVFIIAALLFYSMSFVITVYKLETASHSN
ncbi:MFS transporter [Microbacteriaceae bacterium 4G12]